MKKRCNPHIFNVNPYVPGKPVQEVQRELGLDCVIKLASNESPYPVSPRVLKAIEEAAPHINRYPEGGCFALRQVLAEGLNLDPNQFIFGNGSDEVIVMAIRAFVNEGDEVVIAKPSFLVYSIASSLVGASIKEVPLQNFHYDLDGMAQQITDKTKMIFIGNPDNPAGTFVPHQALANFLARTAKDIIVFIDEAYFEYVQDSSYADSLALMREYPNVIVSRTFSKMYGLAGLRVGYGMAHPEVIDLLNRVREPFNVNSLAQAAAIAAFKDKEHYKKIAIDIEEQRRYLYDALHELGLTTKQTVTNFILIDCQKEAKPLVQSLLEKGVIVRDMSGWGLTTYIRVSIGLEKENKRLIQALKEVI